MNRHKKDKAEQEERFSFRFILASPCFTKGEDGLRPSVT